MDLENMRGIVGIKRGKGLALNLRLVPGVLGPDLPDAGHSQTGMDSGRALRELNGRLLFPGVCDLSNNWQGHLWSPSRKVQVAIERRRKRGGHRLVYSERRTNGDAILVFLDKGPADLDCDVPGGEMGIDREVGGDVLP